MATRHRPTVSSDRLPLPSPELCQSIVFALLADAETEPIVAPMIAEALMAEELFDEACAAAFALAAEADADEETIARPALRLIPGGGQ